MGGSSTVPFTEKDIPDLTGYVAIVTGGNVSIGYETVNQLALHNARVYVAGRSRERVDKAIQQITEAAGGKTLDLRFLQVDLQDLKSVKAAAATFMAQEDRLDIVVNNAGVMTVPYALTGDGYETQWQVNYLAPHIFNSSLLPILESTAEKCESKDRVRVVNVSSMAAMFGPDKPQFDDVNMASTKGMFELWNRYGHSKQASVRDAKELNDRYAAKGITAYSLHPGTIKSNLQSHDPSVIGKIVRLMTTWGPSDTPLQGALNSLYCATSPSAPERGQGKFFMPVAKLDSRADKYLNDPETNKKLWEWGDDVMNRLG